MFIIIQIKLHAYVTSTSMQLFSIVNIEINALVPSVHKFINSNFEEHGIQVNCFSVSCFGSEQNNIFQYPNF